MTRVLVTGARGFVGRYLVEHLERTGADLTAWGRQQVDLLDRKAVARAMAELRPAVVYHCAGAAHVGQSFDNIADTLAANVLGTHHVLDGLRHAGVSARVVITGSSLVYRQCDRRLKEEDPTGPVTPYAVSKLAQEMLGRRAIKEDRQQVLLTRPFNHTGPRQNPTYAAPTFAQQIALIEKGRMRPEIIVGNLEASRDLHDVRDTIRAYTTIAERGEPGRVYNVCSGQAFKIRDVLDRLVGMSRIPVTVTVDPARYRPCDNPMLWGDPTRIERELGWKAEIPLSTTLADLLDYWRKEVQ
ncbi:MAG TPA: GDP-mannose 4,6-dehydratase [Vicinamibacterales bacterium]|nr:GDP-mannose 4,6-dehydratase [Vicinamibacterales bacterium]